MRFYFGLILVFFVSYIMTYGFRKYALKSNILDVPNSRSSHVVPTPRGGGAAMVLAYLLGVLFLGIGTLSVGEYFALLGAPSLVALVGWIDDKKQLGAGIRLGAHLFSAAWIVFWLPPLPNLFTFPLIENQQTFVAILIVMFIAWMINLFNFMDGIDGLASSEVVIFSFCFMALLFVVGKTGSTFIAAGVLGAATLGFLIWNFPPAKIFMGDVGSGFLGVVVCIVLLNASIVDMSLFWSGLILVGFFVADTGVTLIRRLIRGEKIYQAHNYHAYQHWVREVRSHKKVTVSVSIINFVWLFPVAILVASGNLSGLLGLCLAYIPLTFFVVLKGAGSKANGVF